MYASDTLTAAGGSWQAAAQGLLDEAERIGSLEADSFDELGTEDETQAAAERIDVQVDALIHQGDQAFRALEEPASTSSDARFQATSMLVASLAVGDALAIAGEKPSDVFGELGVEPGEPVTFTEARSAVKEAGEIVAGAPLVSPSPPKAPASLATSLEELESTGAKEVWEIAQSNAGKLAGGALVSGIEGVLRGPAAAAFDTVVEALKRWRDALKRGVVRIAKWVVDKLKSLLPENARAKVDDLVKEIQEKLEAGVGEFATDVFGRIMGRPEVEKAWADAAGAGKDLTGQESKLAGEVTVHKHRIEWVTKGRNLIGKFDTVVAAAVGGLTGPGLLAYAALVAAVISFVAFQVWDGFNDIEALVG